MIDDDFMIPNDKFVQYYPELLATQEAPPEFSDTLKVGGFLIMDKIMHDLGLSDILDEVFGSKGSSIKDFIAYMILEKTAVFQHLSSFMYNHPAFEKEVRSDSYISKLLSGMDESDIRHFNQLWYDKNSSDTQSTPLFYELHPGSIIDNSQCKYMVDLAQEYGYRNAVCK